MENIGTNLTWVWSAWLDVRNRGLWESAYGVTMAFRAVALAEAV
jgi:hypothetical protein